MPNNANGSDRSAALARINELIKEIRFAMLTTAAPDGTLHSRPMATQKSEFNGELWFLTRDDSGKVFDIHQDANVSLTYADGKNTFVSLSGRARVSRDEGKIRELWNPMYTAWFPQGKEDPEIRVMQVTVESAEYWDSPNNPVARNFQILLSAATAGKVRVGENEAVTLR